MLKNLFLVDKISLTYNVITSIIIILFFNTIVNSESMLIFRFCFAAIIMALSFWQFKYPNKIIEIFRYLIHIISLAIWYPETFNFNRLLNNQDHLFAHLDQLLFKCQPSYEFSLHYPQKWINELMNLGYFSYYPMIVGTCIILYVKRRELFDMAFAIIMGSFFLYYLIFLAVPVAGPQYYFPAINYEAGQTSFNEIHQYLNTNENLTEEPIGDAYIFRSLVKNSQETGEKPTGAFPSSHVGISTILMLFLFFLIKKWSLVFLPFYILLVAATVYIKAHYLVDVIGGFITAFTFFFIPYLFLIEKKQNKLLHLHPN